MRFDIALILPNSHTAERMARHRRYITISHRPRHAVDQGLSVIVLEAV